MLFSSIPFLYYFLPCVIAVYFVVPRFMKNTVLLLSSLFFYGYGEPKFLVFMLLSIMQGYIFGCLIGNLNQKAETPLNRKKAKLLMIISVVASLLLLCYCKYIGFFIENFNALTGLSLPMLKIALPIGISFYTFQNISYVVDVYRGRVKCQRNFINLALYIAMFPQLIAGPIVRYQDIENQLDNRIHSVDKGAKGVRRFVIGLSKKVLLANVLGEVVAAFKDNPDEKTVVFVWLYAIAYTLHIYFDFSGYSDMAIGLGHIFGFTLPENFNYPYISKSITEFWRRWHITLGKWFRDYVYISMGGNRVSTARWIFNILVVWMATGFWHGAAWNFILWGLMYAMLLLMEKTIRKATEKNRSKNSHMYLNHRERKIWALLKQITKHTYTMFFVTLGFIIFDTPTLSQAAENITLLFGGGNYEITSDYTVFLLQSYATTIITAIALATPLVRKIYTSLSHTKTGKAALTFLEPIIIAALIMLSTAYLVDGSFNPFLYFRF